VARYGRKIRHLSLSACKFFGVNDQVSFAWTELPSLQSLDLSYSNVSNRDLISIVSSCPNLVILNLESTKEIRSNGIMAVAQHCKNLEQINLSECGMIPDWRKKLSAEITAKAFEFLVKSRGEKLKKINFANQHQIGSTSSVIEALSTHATGLEFLNLDLRVFPSKSKLFAEAFSHLLSRCQLKGLVVGEMGFDHVTLVTEHCPNLEFYVDVGQRTECHSPHLYAQLVSSSTKLKHLQLPKGSVNDQVLESIGRNLPNLEFLNVNFLEANSSGLKHIAKCTKLRHLEILTQLKDDCKDNDSIICITSHCTMLEYLEIGKAFIGTEGMDAISTLKNLKYLSVTPMSSFGKSSVLNLASRCKFLEEFHIPWTPGIDDETICTLAQNCGELRVVEWHNKSPGEQNKLWGEIGGKQNVTGKSLMALGNNCRNLQKLTLYGGNAISDESLIAIANGCHFLTDIKLQQCQGVGDLGVNKLIMQCPFLENVDFQNSKGLTCSTLVELRRKGILK